MPGDCGQADELERLQQRNRELEVVFDTIRDLVSTLSVQEVMQRLLDRMLVHLDSEIGSVLVVEPDETLRILLARGLPDQVVRNTHVKLGESISGWVAQQGESLLVEDVESDPRFQRLNRERYYTNSFISTPLFFQGSVRGVINVNNKRNRQSFTAEDLKLLEAIAGHAAVALANAHRYEEVLGRAQHDALTGLANHGHFWSSLSAELNRSDRYSHAFSLIMIDVDHFKQYNDRHGHISGDDVLRSVANVINEQRRSCDHAARYGGDEFCVLLPETSLEGARIFAVKIREAVEESCHTPKGDGPITVSLGVASYPDDGRTAIELVKAADEQLYHAKDQGRNRVCTAPS
ncbi:MAG: GGDEF domain-containing protein [Deltaproteobacteria bacterium]|nr:MAG: GGDEF domain-containing protein [Deltaproteobacteria bacterium]